jgi:dolichol kinase
MYRLSYKIKSEMIRKFLQFFIVMLNFVISYLFGVFFSILAVGLGFVILLSLRQNSKLLTSIRNVKRKSFGEYYLFIGLMILNIFYLFLPNLNSFIFATYVLGVVDIFTIFGPKVTKLIPFFKNLLPSEEKTVGGLVILISLTFIATISLKFDFLKSFTLITILTIADIYSKNGLDNATLPVVSYFFSQN